jgi:TonB family protein
MISYILEISICWAGFYGLYTLLLRQTTFFQANRWYLLGTLVLGLLLPLGKAALPVPEAALPVAYYLQPITVGVEQLEVAVVASGDATGGGMDYYRLLGWLYALGVLFFGGRLGYGLWQIGRLYRGAQKERRHGYMLVRTSTAHLPFSFFNCLFWSEKIDLESEDARAIIRHEQAHINGWHSFDVLLLEILGVALWCSPFPYLYRRSLRTIHEYLADEAVLQTAGRKKYGHLLLRQSLSGLQIALVNHFFQTQLKQRIMMMKQRKTARRALARYFLAVPLALLFTLVFHNRELIGQTLLEIHQPDGAIQQRELQSLDELDALFAPDEILTVDVRKHGAQDQVIVRLKGAEIPSKTSLDTLPLGEEIFKVVEEMPRFPGCEDQASPQNCANQKMLEFIYQNLKYPADAREAQQEGTVVASFVVNKTGRLVDFKIVRSIHPSLDAEVLRVVRLMNELELPWVAGKQRGRAVNVMINLPIRFKLDAEAAKPQNSGAADDIFKVVEEMPRFPGCEEEPDTQTRKQCADRKMLEFLYRNIKYPAEARNSAAQGTGVLRLVIGETGRVEAYEVVRHLHPALNEEMLRLARLVQEQITWVPGRQGGKAVKVQLLLPIKYALPDENATEQGGENASPPPHTLEKLVVEGYRNPLAAPASAARLAVRNFLASPNPSSGQLRLRFEAPAYPTLVRLLDSNGREAQRENLSRFEGLYDQQLDLSKLPKGAYIIHISQGDKVHTEKVILN